MADITREHIQHIVNEKDSLAARNHSLIDRIDALIQKLSTAMSATKSAAKSVASSAAKGLTVTPVGPREHFIRTAEVNGAAFLGGLAQGKAGPDGGHFLGVPVEAWLGAGLEALGYFGVGGDQLAEHAINFGDGFLAAWSSSTGFHVGNNWRTTGHMFGHKDGPALAASNGTAVKGEITPQHMAQIVARVRGAAAMHGMDPTHG